MQELSLPGQPEYIAASKAYWLMDEYVSSVKHNWAEDKVKYINQAMRSCVKGTARMSIYMKYVMSRYISDSAALNPSVGVGDVQLTRSRRHVLNRKLAFRYRR
eukprot:TRINITY_DN13189_c0_g1_i1.p1 TRINITY_DN13189_c0_g1~~TRINITY_DN13189_c0_g1_i1.p1  ORF type:complete len:103 (-),score=18.61 TRINITY_DN13189_c0_g1_i1:229-537(-)